MDDIFQTTVVQSMNLVVVILGSLGVMGLVLAIAGLYAVVAYQVTRRTREIGIRLALGAERPQVMRMILKQAAAMCAAGIGAGLVLSYALNGVLSAGSEPSQSSDPWLVALVPLALFATSLLAAAIPARAAMRVDPQIALREE
jgi:putative ABC transport system permease protein